MVCTNPIRLGEGFVVPCGKCMACRIHRTQEWATRILHESSYYQSNTFVTLTYDDEHLPSDGSLRKEDVQLYLKRLRSRLDGRIIKYYAAGEYGELNGRPHYHLIIMNVGRVKDVDVLDRSWSKGFIYLRPVTAESVRYVTAYVQKKLSGPKAKEVYGDKTPPFNIMSKSIGKRWAIENKDYLNKYKGITVKGKPVGLPRYYTKVVEIDLGKLEYYGDGMIPDELNDRVIRRRDKRNLAMPETEQWKFVQAKRLQDSLTLEQKVSMKKRK